MNAPTASPCSITGWRVTKRHWLSAQSLGCLLTLFSPEIARAQAAAPADAEAPATPEAPATSATPIFRAPGIFKPGLRDTRFAIPDIAPDRLLFPQLSTSFLTVRPGIEVILDWTGFGQDQTSIDQVGQQHDQLEMRSASFELAGEIGLKRRLGYKVGIEYNGFDVNPDSSFAITDIAVDFAIPKWRTRVFIGQMREDFGYEVVGSMASMPQSERVIAPFASPVNLGVKVVHVLGTDDRMTLSYGLFKNHWGAGEGDALFSGRITRLVVDDPQNRRFLHLGVGLRLTGANDSLRYYGRPGVNAADVFVDTGNFDSQSARHLGLEAHYSDGPWSIIGEYVSAKAAAPEVGNPRFQAFYVLGSWILTGESRPYDRTRGTVRRITPNGRWGALELVTRYANVDLDGGTVTGGRYDRIEAGANWWATTRWKFGLLYGHVRLKRFGETGHTDSLLARWQWIY